jgi:hypothetical protein
VSADLLPAAVVWAALAYKLAFLRRSTATPAARALLGVLVWLALSTTLFAPPVYRLIGEVTGEPNLAILLAQSCGLVVLWPACNLLLYQQHGEASARRIARRRYLLLPGLLVLSVALWWLGRGDRIEPEYVYRSADVPGAVAFMMIHHAALAVAGVYCWRSCARRSRTASGDLRWGLRLVAGAGAGALVMVTYDASFFAATLLDVPTDLWGDVPVVMATMLHTSTTLLAVGATVPDWGPRALHAARTVLALHRLQPLWREVTSAVPGVVLAHAYSRWDLSRRLHRTVVEIRDAQLVLRSHQPSAEEVAALTAASRLRGADLKAYAEAADLALSVRMKAQGVPRPPGASYVPAPPAGSSLRDEVDWLVRVARHYPRARDRAMTSAVLGPRSRSTPPRPPTARASARPTTSGR